MKKIQLNHSLPFDFAGVAAISDYEHIEVSPSTPFLMYRSIKINSSESRVTTVRVVECVYVVNSSEGDFIKQTHNNITHNINKHI